MGQHKTIYEVSPQRLENRLEYHRRKGIGPVRYEPVVPKAASSRRINRIEGGGGIRNTGQWLAWLREKREDRKRDMGAV